MISDELPVTDMPSLEPAEEPTELPALEDEPPVEDDSQ